MSRKNPHSSSQKPRSVRKKKTNKNKTLNTSSSLSSQKGEKIKKLKKQVKPRSSALGDSKNPSEFPRGKPLHSKCEESEEARDNSSKPKGSPFLTESGNDGKREDPPSGSTPFRLSLIEHHPKTTGSAALAKVETFSLDRFAELKTALSIAEAFASVIWKDNTPIAKDFVAADSVTLDWDTPDHEMEMPERFKVPETAKAFIESLLKETGIPLPNFFYVTRRGIRMTWVLTNTITDADHYLFLVTKIAADLGADLEAVRPTTIYNTKKHIEVFGIHLVHTVSFNAGEYASLPPVWAMDGDDESYPKALEHFSLVIGQSAPSSQCPLGGHEGKNPNSVRAYANGVFCFSAHGYIRKSKVVELAGLSKSRISLYQLAKREITRFAPKHDLIELLRFEIKNRMKKADIEGRQLAELLFNCIIVELEQDKESQWSLRREYFHHNKYALELREYCGATGLRQLLYPEAKDDKFQPTYLVDKYEFRDFPGGGRLDLPLLKKLSSPLFFMMKEVHKDGSYTIHAHPTPDMSRFLGERLKQFYAAPFTTFSPTPDPLPELSPAGDF